MAKLSNRLHNANLLLFTALGITVALPNKSQAASSKYDALYAGVEDCGEYLVTKNINIFSAKINEYPREIEDKGTAQFVYYPNKKQKNGFFILAIDLINGEADNDIHVCGHKKTAMPDWATFKDEVLPSLKVKLETIGFVQLNHPLWYYKIFANCNASKPYAFIGFQTIIGKYTSFGGQVSDEAEKFCTDFDILK